LERKIRREYLGRQKKKATNFQNRVERENALPKKKLKIQVADCSSQQTKKLKGNEKFLEKEWMKGGGEKTQVLMVSY